MKRLILTIALVFSGLSLFGQSDFTVGQFNIRYNNPKDVEKGAAWADRLPRICNMINYHGWDLFGAQEVLHGQLLDLLKGLDGYDYVGVGRNDGDKKGEYAPIFYKRSRMKCLQSGHFWISETPDVVGSKGWDANQCRICTWAEGVEGVTQHEMLKAYADTHGHEYADYFSAMTDGNDAMKKEYQQDAVHPNKAGYIVMEEVIQSILNK